MSTYALMVRDKLMTKMQALAFFTGKDFHFYTNKSVQIQPQNVPFAGIYLIEEIGTPDGDDNTGEVRFRTMARYGFSVIVQNNDADAAENKLDEAMAAISSMFADPTLYNWEKAGQPNEVAIQAFSRGLRSHHLGAVGGDNELPIAEVRFDLTCDLGTITYPPTVTDPFEVIHIETQFPSGGTVEEIAAVQQVEAVWNIQQGYYLADGARLRGAGALRVNATVI